jgi:hypothetical protein
MEARSRVLGALLTWVGSVGAVLVALPLLVGGCVALSIAGAGADPSHTMFECADAECVQQYLMAAAICGVALAIVVVLLLLVLRGTPRALVALTVMGGLLAVAMGGLALRATDVSAGLLGFVTLMAASLALGSWLRLRARSPVERPGGQ